MDSVNNISIAPGVFIPPLAIRVQFSRGSGPGGQNVNKLNSRCEVWVSVSGIVGMTDDARYRLRQFAGKRLTQLDEIHIASDEHRTQEMNRHAVLERVRELCVRAIHEPRKRRKTRPTKASRQRRLSEKKHRSDIKQARRPGGAGNA